MLMLFGRIGFFVWLSPLSAALDAVDLQAFWVGARFDLRIAMIAALTALPWLWLPKFNALARPGFRIALRGWMALLFLLLVLIWVFDAGHYLYLQKRLDAAAFDLLKNADISTQMVWESYPVVWISLGLLVLLLGFNRLHRWAIGLSLATEAHMLSRTRFWLQGGVSAVLATGLVLICLQGRLGAVPLRWNHAYFAGDAEVATFALNAPISVYSSLKFRSQTLDTELLAARKADVFSALQAEGAVLDEGLTRRQLPVNPKIPAGEQANVVIVMLESFGASRLQALGNPLVATPNLDRLTASSWWFPNFFVPAVSTAKSVFASFTGIPDVSAVDTASRNPYASDQRNFVEQMPHRPFYFLGGSTGWANIGGFIQRSIPQMTIVEDGDWQSPTVDVWGVSDRALITESADILKGATQPLWAYVQTAANHRPYTIADTGGDLQLLDVSEEQAIEAGFEGLEQLHAVQLLDHNMGYLIEYYQSLGLYENTVFVFFGDHQGSNNKTDFLPSFIEDLDLHWNHSFLMIHAPKWVEPRRDERLASLVDLQATIAGLSESEFTNYTFGRNLNDPRFNHDAPIYLHHHGQPWMAILRHLVTPRDAML
ncbi:MAG: LTA synthase family protein [Gammaproteobacteria bacterium]|nr:LTA synthase family protein [Gammaproteobacteria bacterium]